LFVRRSTFVAVGGYSDLPLMEDVDLVRRIGRTGRILHSRAAVRTSARRWEREGWFRRSARNGSLATRFLFGTPPARLAQEYYRRQAAAVVIMARAPWTGGKTRLAVGVDDATHAGLRQALFLDTLDEVTSVGHAEHIVAGEPAMECERMRELAGARVDVIAQRGADLCRRLVHVFEDVFRMGIESVVVLGSDLPDLPPRLLRAALDALREHSNRIVLGPAADGGYYLIGMNHPHPELFERIDWSTDRVLEQTQDAARRLGLPVVLLDPWTDLDDAAGLAALMDRKGDSGAKRTRAWAIEHLPYSGSTAQPSSSDQHVLSVSRRETERTAPHR
jgi:rSAM/selenodomain-associated transferase 1